MSTAVELVQIVAQAGGKFLLDGDRLGILPKEAGEPLIRELKERKAEILELLRARMRESFRRWLNIACLRSDRWFTNINPLHRSFCALQSELGDTQPTLSDFQRLLEAADFLIAPIDDVTLVSGLGFRSDLEATNRQSNANEHLGSM